MIKIDNIKPGNTVRVWQKIREGSPRGEAGEKTRLQAFEGLVISHKHGQEPGATFTVRRVIEGIGVERIFPLFSPNIEKIDLVKRAQARRAKLYYVREKAAREISKKMKQMKREEKEAQVEKLENSLP